MAESTLALKFDDIYAAIGDLLGVGRTVPNADATTDARIVDVLNSGLRQAYFPPPHDPKEPPHRWSWLDQIATLATANGTSTYQLPDNCGGILSEITISGQQQVAIAEELWVRGELARDSAVSKPLYAAVRPKAGTSPLRYELILCPTPDAIYTLNFRQNIQPDAPTLGTYPIGGAQYSELFLESCLAVAENRIDDGKSKSHHDRFLMLLADAIRLDVQQRQRTTDATWTFTTPRSDIALGYDELLSQVGLGLGFVGDKNAWNHFQLKHADFIVQEGYRQFLYPPPLAEKEASHNWSFLRQLGTLSTIVSTTDYALPANVGGIVGDMTYPVGSQRQLVGICDEMQIRAALAQDSTQGPPKYCGIKATNLSGNTGTRYTATLFPIPDAVYTLLYRYNLIPAPLVAGDTPIGGAQHAQTILESCLAIVEKHTKNGGTWHQDNFKALLAQSVRIDKQLTEVSVTSPWPTLGASATLGVTYRDLLREAARAMDFTWDPANLTHEQRNLANTIVQQAYRKVLCPPPLKPGETSYEWSWLKFEKTLATVSGVDTYQLPSDFGSLDGDLYWSSQTSGWMRVQVLGPSEIREYQQGLQSQAGLPRYAAVVMNSEDGTADVTFSLVLWPEPDGAYTFTYRYKRIPPLLSDTTPIPFGGPQHAELLLQAVLAVAELRKLELHGVPVIGRGRRPYVPKPQGDEFMQRLAASISADQRLKPAALGYNRERSDVDSSWPVGRGVNMTFNGVSI